MHLLFLDNVNRLLQLTEYLAYERALQVSGLLKLALLFHYFVFLNNNLLQIHF